MPPAATAKPASRASLWSACLGNLFEHYDTALFSCLVPFLAPLLFPGQDPVAALILTYAIAPLGMLARFLGALVFGCIGDRRGRGQALFLSLAGMGIVSGCIGLCPTYTQIGLAAPLLIYAGRLLQNFLAAGEVTGGAVFLLEQTPERSHDLLSGLYNSSTIAGILLASAGVACLGQFHCIAEGWRWLYFFGVITAFFGCVARRRFATASPARTPFRLLDVYRTLKQERKALLLIALASGFSYANYVVALVLMSGFLPLVSSVTKEEILTLNTSLLVLDFLALPLFGWIASKSSREKIMLASAAFVAVLGVPLIMLLEGASWPTIILVRVCLVVTGVAFFAPFYSWAQRLASPQNRYLVLSFGYALGAQLLGTPTAALSLWLFKITGIPSSTAWYWVLLALCNVLMLRIFASKKEASDLVHRHD